MSRHELIYGRHVVSGIFAQDLSAVRELWVQQTRRDPVTNRLVDQAAAAGIAVHRVSRKSLDHMVSGARHQGVVIRYRGTSGRRASADLDALLEGASDATFLLILDGVQDPHNLGACLRSASAAGVHGVLMPRRRSVGLTPTVRKVACGAAESVPIVQVPNLADSLRRLRDQDVQIVGTAADATTSIYDAELTGPVALVIGGEEHGLRRLTQEHCDLLLRIPMAGAVESLNLSVAAAIFLFEARRQRGIVD